MLVDIDSMEDFNDTNSGSIVAQKKMSQYLPVTRYYGSKRRIIDWIRDSVSDLRFNTVLDAFGGTATVSLMFKSLGKKSLL